MVPVKGGWWWGGSYSNKKMFEKVQVHFKLRITWLICNYYLQPTWTIELWPKTTTTCTDYYYHYTHHLHITLRPLPTSRTTDRGESIWDTSVSQAKNGKFFFFWTNQCSIIYLGSNLQTMHQVGKREPAVTKNVPKQRQTCHLGLGTKVSLFFFFFSFWLILYSKFRS